MVPDILALFVIGYETRRIAQDRGSSVAKLFYREELMFASLITFAMVMVGQNL